jgi:hypothetical protein
MRPDKLSRLIVELFDAYAKDQAKYLTREARGKIGDLPPSYATQRDIPVDNELLVQTIRTICNHPVLRKSSEISWDRLSLALSETPCHYLWFC